MTHRATTGERRALQIGRIGLLLGVLCAQASAARAQWEFEPIGDAQARLLVEHLPRYLQEWPEAAVARLRPAEAGPSHAPQEELRARTSRLDVPPEARYDARCSQLTTAKLTQMIGMPNPRAVYTYGIAAPPDSAAFAAGLPSSGDFQPRPPAALAYTRGVEKTIAAVHQFYRARGWSVSGQGRGQPEYLSPDGVLRMEFNVLRGPDPTARLYLADCTHTPGGPFILLELSDAAQRVVPPAAGLLAALRAQDADPYDLLRTLYALAFVYSALQDAEVLRELSIPPAQPSDGYKRGERAAFQANLALYRRHAPELEPLLRRWAHLQRP